MKTSFENLYMSESMHDVFNRKSMPTADEAAALMIFAPRRRVSREEFTFEAMLAASDNYSMPAVDLSRYAA